MVEISNRSKQKWPDEVPVESLVGIVLAELGRVGAECQIEYLGHEAIQKRNRDLLGHDYPTDVISMDLSMGQTLWFELMLGVEEIEENAKEYGVSRESELMRCVVHGLLHMTGWEDNDEGMRHRMRLEEDRLLELFHVEHRRTNEI